MNALLIVIAIIYFVSPLFFIKHRPLPGPNRFGHPAPPLGFMPAVESFFANYFNFRGRASRSAFWWVSLFTAGVNFALVFIDGTETLSNIFGFATLVPALAIGARRLHDTNRSGWLQLLMLLFPVGTILLVVWYCRKGSEGASAAPPPRPEKRPVALLNIERW